MTYLTKEETWAFICQVRERSELVKHKKENFTLEEQRIRINGERAFKALLRDCHHLIWSIIDRFNFAPRFDFAEMYCIAVKEFERAISTYNPYREKTKYRFTSWVFLLVRTKFIRYCKSELGYVRRDDMARQNLVNNIRVCDERTPLEVATELDFWSQFGNIVSEVLDPRKAKFFAERYFDGKESKEIAQERGMNLGAVKMNNQRSRRILKADPRVRELAQDYLIA